MRSAAFLFLLLLAASPLTAIAQDANQKLAVRHLRLGQDALQAEQFDEAEREFKQAIELDPILELAHYGLGQTYMATRRYVQAVQAFVSTRDAFQRAAADQMINGVEGERRIDDQIRSLRDQRHALESGRIRTTTNLSNKLTQIDDQIRQLEGMRRRDRSSPPVTPTYISLALGSAYFRTSAFPDAEREWRAALQVDPKLGEAHNNLAVVLMLSGRLDDAEREMQLAEKNGHRVSEAFKSDLKTRQAARE